MLKKRFIPPAHLIFRAFDACPFDEVKVVLLGQDPYHGPLQANGLCFSVNTNVKPPPSLINIFKEIEADLKHPISRETDLSRWAKQGVLLLNATLTGTRLSSSFSSKSRLGSFYGCCYRNTIGQKRKSCFLAWGAYARRKGVNIDRNKHLVFESAHPSPLSAHNGFFGSRHFSQTNAYLIAHGLTPIEW